ncbi:MAG TPA: LemA family protein [Fimbriimonadaceae bacterium]|nr:LemA family protein [Fimbriimonadaceae bacterium]
MSELIVLFICAGGVPLIWAIVTLNNFARLQNLMRESWANIDVALKRRHDLIPNLVETVKGHAAHESEVLERVVSARERALAGSSVDENELAKAVNLLLARVEAYPELTASTSFQRLQQELINTEDRIAAARRFYNANVRDYNMLLQSFPASLLRGGRKEAEFYKVDAIQVREPIAITAQGVQ